MAEVVPEKRTPKIIRQAIHSEKEEILVPRGVHPMVRRDWLVHGFLFEVEKLYKDAQANQYKLADIIISICQTDTFKKLNQQSK